MNEWVNSKIQAHSHFGLGLQHKAVLWTYNSFADSQLEFWRTNRKSGYLDLQMFIPFDQEVLSPSLSLNTKIYVQMWKMFKVVLFTTEKPEVTSLLNNNDNSNNNLSFII